MKKLNTLVDDIYGMVHKLNQGESILPDLEPHLEAFNSAIKDVLVHWAIPRDVERNDGLRMSNIGRPARQLYFDMRADGYKDSMNDPSTQIKFLYGHILEQVALLLIKSSGHVVDNEQEAVEVEGIKGTMDCTIDGEVVDIKTASSFAFNKFINKKLSEDDPFGYLVQLSGYEKANKTNNGGFFVINKESGELCLFVPDDLDKPNVDTVIKYVKTIETLDSPPDLCYPDIPNGVAGNMEISKNCNYCNHKEVCRKDANEGKGLRKFQYAGGAKWFTVVVKEPKVEEII